MRNGTVFNLVTIALAFTGVALGQATPAATATLPLYNPGPSLPLLNGTYSYSLTASGILQVGQFGSGATTTEALSGDLEYVSPNRARPFSMLYSGGVLFSSYVGQGTTFFQSLTASQGLVFGRWAMGVSDSVSYLPQSPVIGLSGVAGVGDLGLQPLPIGGPPVQSVLTNYAPEIMNTVSGNIERALNGKTTLSGTASYNILDFTQGGGLSSNQIMGEAGINRRLDARDNVGVNASYSTFSYSSLNTSFNVRSANIEFDRQWTRRLSTQVSAGPQAISGFNSLPIEAQYFGVSSHPHGAATPPVFVSIPVPGQLTFAANVGVSYLERQTSAVLSYSRGVNAGSGVQIGGFSDTVSASVTHKFTRVWTGSGVANYSRTSGLITYPPTTNESVGIQANRAIGRRFSAYGSYTGIHQSVAGSLAAHNAFSGFYNVFAVGISFSPTATHIGQF